MKINKKPPLRTPPVPPGYRRTDAIDLIRNRKQMITVLVLSVLLMAAAFAVICMIEPVWKIWQGVSVPVILICLLLGCAGTMAYIVLHELVHGAVMYLFSRVKPVYGFSLAYAWAGSTHWFTKAPYIIIALAPLLFWGTALGLLMARLQGPWFWAAGMVQIMNVSGSAGDIYVACRVARMRRDVLINDTGTAMTVVVPADEHSA